MTGILIYQDEKLIARKTNQFYENSKLKTSEIFLLVENHLFSQFRKVFEGNYNYYDNGNVKDYFGTNFKIETVALYTVSNKTKFHYNFRYIKY